MASRQPPGLTWLASVYTETKSGIAIMKHKTLLLPLAVAALTFGLTGCGKTESANSTVEDANKAAVAATDAANKASDAAKAEAAKAAETARAEAAKTAEAARAEAAKVAEAAKAEAAKVEAAKVEAAKVEAAKVEAAKAAATAKTQELIVKATSLVAEGKYSDASAVLQQLAGQTLSSDQQKLVDGLKAQIEKALVAKAAGDAAGSVGDLLKK